MCLLLMQTPAFGEVVFDDQVWPILEQRCLRCHNQNRAEGDLVFDAGRDWVVRGGHTGRSILGPSAAKSELIRRITSTEDGYRMPKEGPPLTEIEIETLTTWVDQGADWSDNHDRNKKDVNSDPATNSDGSQSFPAINAADALVWFEQQMQTRGFGQLVYLSGAFFVTAAVLLLLRRKFKARWSRISFLQTMLAVVLAFLCAGTYVHYHAKYESVVVQLESVKSELVTYTGPPQRGYSLEIPHPMHPPRLGGVYYRGNDERDDRLFNRGFYRTATLEVWLTDQQGTRIKPGDVVRGPLYVEFIIKRAANTTGELFSDHIMAVIGICDDVEIVDQGAQTQDRYRTTVGDVVAMQPVESGQQWNSRIQISDRFVDAGGAGADGADDVSAIQGKLYVVQNTSRPKVHYGIEFEIQIDSDGRISESSQLWMGSLYNLNGRVFVPYDDQKILLDRWFDFRPIPEITGPQTDDPDLLGVPEHLGTQ